MDNQTYHVLNLLENTKVELEEIYNNAGIENTINALDFLIIEENINRIKLSISEIKRYSKGQLKSFSTTSTLNIIENNQFEVLGSSSLIYMDNIFDNIENE